MDVILKMLDRTDARTRALLGDLSAEQLAVPYHPDINPPIWELGHCAFFYDFFLLRHLGDQQARMPGYDDVWDSLENYHEDRWREGAIPGLPQTMDYYLGIIDDVRTFLKSGHATPHQLYLCAYSIYHQDMHIESLIQERQTLSYPAPAFAREPAETPSGRRDSYLLGDAVVPAGSYPIGLPAGAPTFEKFCFDNEKPGFMAELDSFAISKTLLSCGEFLEFVNDDGYARDDLWSFGGKHWLRDYEHHHPSTWKQQHGQWLVRSFDRWLPLHEEHPVISVSYWEAEAYCRWAGRRLPTEYEWEAAARGKAGNLFPWGDTMEPSRVDMDGERMGRIAVDALPEGASPFGCRQMIGTTWEWTSNPYLPYDGFCVDMYAYMSTLQFGTHKTTKGGSCATSSQLIRSTYRQAYLPSRNNVFTGFRTCAID